MRTTRSPRLAVRVTYTETQPTLETHRWPPKKSMCRSPARCRRSRSPWIARELTEQLMAASRDRRPRRAGPAYPRNCADQARRDRARRRFGARRRAPARSTTTRLRAPRYPDRPNRTDRADHRCHARRDHGALLQTSFVKCRNREAASHRFGRKSARCRWGCRPRKGADWHRTTSLPWCPCR